MEMASGSPLTASELTVSWKEPVPRIWPAGMVTLKAAGVAA